MRLERPFRERLLGVPGPRATARGEGHKSRPRLCVVHRGSWSAIAIAIATSSCAVAVTPAADGSGLAFDAGTDGTTDVAPADAVGDGVHAEVRGPLSAVARARDRDAPSADTAVTWLVVGSREATRNAFLVEPRFVLDAVSLDRTVEIPGTEGWEPIAAARDGNLVATFLQKTAALPEIALVDGATGALLATAPLTELTAGTPQYAWIALRGGRVTCAASVFDPDRLAVETFAFESGALRQTSSQRLDGHFEAALYDDSDVAGVVMAAITPTHHLDLYRVGNSGLERLPDGAEDTVLPTSDGPTLLRLTDDRFVVDGQDLGPLPPLGQINGNISVAAGSDGSLVIGVSADGGRMLIGSRRRATEPVRWTEVPGGFSSGLRGEPAAHTDGVHFGVFYLETFLGSEQPAVRYFGLPDGP